MIRRARTPLTAILLGFAGGLVFVAGAGAIIAPADDATAQVTETTAAITTTTQAGYDGIEPGNRPQTATTSTTTTAPPAAADPGETTEAVEPAHPVIDLAAVRPPPQRPTRVRIGKIGVDATIIDLGLNPDRTLEVPEDIRLTGWWTGRSVPGEDGPSIVVGHVDSAALGPGVFWRLRELEVGDLVHIERSDGSVAEFRVTETELVLKSEFPTEKVYGSTEGSKLRLITCGGDFDSSQRSYLGNLIVYAEHIGTTQPGAAAPAAPDQPIMGSVGLTPAHP